MKLTEKDIFIPVLRQDMRRTYPELAKISEFKGMSSVDIKFCWYYAVYYADEQDHSKRITSAVKNSYHDGLDERTLKRYLDGDFSDAIRAAIKKFESFDIGARIRSKFVSERILAGFEKLVETDVNGVGVIVIYDDKSGVAIGEKRDWNQVNAFVNSMTKINESIPGLLQRVEESYGIRSQRTTAEDSEGIRDRYLEHKKEQENIKNKKRR